VECSLTAAGELMPNTARWYMNGAHAPAFDDSDMALWRCGQVSVRVVVTDDAGMTELRQNVNCRR
jgi:hypothetical protein